jgi:membrane fusion protein (multidrug efflux system)
MYAHVRIVVETKPGALLLPTDAVLAEKTRSSVFTVADNKAKRLTVKIGLNDAGWMEILDGLNPEQPVILVGKQTLTDGQPVTVVEGK